MAPFPRSILPIEICPEERIEEIGGLFNWVREMIVDIFKVKFEDCVV
jgi:hypothetical protein